MQTKTLYTVAIIVTALVGTYYYLSGKKEKLDIAKQSNISYSASNVRVIQSDEQGQLALRASIEQAQHDLKTRRSAMKNVQATMFEGNKVDATFSAKQVHGENDNEKVVLSDQIIARKFNEHDVLQVETEQLTLYPKQKTLETNHQVTVQSAQAQFTSQGLKADLNTQQYEFSTIRGQYDVQQ